MLTAKEAFKESYYNKKVLALMEKIEACVLDAIKNSRFSVSVESYDNDPEIYRQMISIMEQQGYKVSVITKDSSKHSIEISWEDFTIDNM